MISNISSCTATSIGESLPSIDAFFDSATATISYVVADPATGMAAIIDPVLDYDPKSGRTTTLSADNLLQFIRNKKLTIKYILETHVHADHLSSASYLREISGAKIAISKEVLKVQTTFKKLFNTEKDFHHDDNPFDYLLNDNDVLLLGSLSIQALSVPGHTPADMAYRIGDAVFVGDTLFMPDVGSARCDFPGGDAATLYQSVQRLLALPAQTRLFMCHDYPPTQRAVNWETTVAEQREQNIHFGHQRSEEEFVALREARDAQLSMPVLLLPAIQVNINAGKLPPAESNGLRYLKIPLNAL